MLEINKRYLARFVRGDSSPPVFATECLVPGEPDYPGRVLSQFIGMQGIPAFSFEGNIAFSEGRRYHGMFLGMRVLPLFGIFVCGGGGPCPIWVTVKEVSVTGVPYVPAPPGIPGLPDNCCDGTLEADNESCVHDLSVPGTWEVPEIGRDEFCECQYRLNTFDSGCSTIDWNGVFCTENDPQPWENQWKRSWLVCVRPISFGSSTYEISVQLAVHQTPSPTGGDTVWTALDYIELDNVGQLVGIGDIVLPIGSAIPFCQYGGQLTVRFHN